MTDDPSGREIAEAIVDSILSIKAVDVLKRKFEAQSAYEFFNRTEAVGVFLFTFGALSLVSTLLLVEYDVSLFDVTNSFVVIGVFAVSIFAVLIMESVNEAISPVSRTAKPTFYPDLARFLSGLVVMALLVYQLFINMDPLEGMAFLTIAFVGVSIPLVGLSWLFGGLSGVWREYNSEGTDED